MVKLSYTIWLGVFWEWEIFICPREQQGLHLIHGTDPFRPPVGAKAKLLLGVGVEGSPNSSSGYLGIDSGKVSTMVFIESCLPPLGSIATPPVKYRTKS